MTGIVLTAHVVTALLTLGPVAVAASMFPRYARVLRDSPTDIAARSAAGVLHRISRIYAIIALAIPAFGVIVAVQWEKLDQPWLLVSIALTIAAAALLGSGILPAQRRVLTAERGMPTPRRIAMLTGLFNLAWVAVAVLMVLQPGAPRGGFGG